MKIENINVTYVVHSLASLVLLATLALFGYEVSKPKINTVEASGIITKMSPLSPKVSAPEQIHHLPALSERFRHKILVCAVRQKSWKPAKPGKNFVQTPVAGKAYMALNQSVSAEGFGNQ